MLRKYWWVVLIAAVLLAPVAVYVGMFGVRLSHEHGRWGEMGSAMSGIYAPVTALLTLIVLAFQVRLQRQLNEHLITKDTVDSFCAEIDNHLRHLESVLNAEMNDIPVKTHLARTVGHIVRVEELDWLSLRRSVLGDIDVLHPDIRMAWVAIIEILANLRVESGPSYQKAYRKAHDKLSMVLTDVLCWALDHHVWVCLEGESRLDYAFSPFLRANKHQ
jgi:hypothetical protein